MMMTGDGYNYEMNEMYYDSDTILILTKTSSEY